MIDSGVVQAVTKTPLGATLAADLYSGATTLTVSDTSDFDSINGGWLNVAGHLVQYTAVDDVTGVITLAAALA